MSDWFSAATGAGGGLLVAFFSWLLGRSETAQERRRSEMRRVAREVYSEEKIGERLVALETKVDGTASSVTEIRTDVKSIDAKLDQILLDHIPIRRHT